MARFRPLRWLARAVEAIFRAPEPPTPPPRPRPPSRPTARPRPAARPTQPPVARVARFYTRDAPARLSDDYTVSSLVGDAWLNPNIDPDTRMELRQALRDYVRSEYDLRWEDYFDWEAWREEMGY